MEKNITQPPQLPQNQQLRTILTCYLSPVLLLLAAAVNN